MTLSLEKHMLLLSSPLSFLSSITSQTVRGYCDRQSDLLLMYFFFSVINCMLNEWLDTIYKSQLTPDYLTFVNLNALTPLLRIRELPSQLRMQLSTSADVFPLIPAHDFQTPLLNVNTEVVKLARWRTSQEIAVKMKCYTECKTMNTDLSEWECT